MRKKRRPSLRYKFSNKYFYCKSKRLMLTPCHCKWWWIPLCWWWSGMRRLRARWSNRRHFPQHTSTWSLCSQRITFEFGGILWWYEWAFRTFQSQITDQGRLLILRIISPWSTLFETICNFFFSGCVWLLFGRTIKTSNDQILFAIKVDLRLTHCEPYVLFLLTWDK